MFRPTAAEMSVYRFNSLMDWRKSARDVAEVERVYNAAILRALRNSTAASAAAKALPNCWVSYSVEESREKSAHYNKVQNNAYRLEQHYYALRRSYAQELAFAIWHAKETAYRAEWDRRMAVWRAACDAHRDEQKAFESAGVDTAMAALPAHLTEDTRKQIRRVLTYAIYKKSRCRARSAKPIRVLRGLPPVPCGSLPNPPYPKPMYLEKDPMYL
jgi:hypothetical protein